MLLSQTGYPELISFLIFSIIISSALVYLIKRDHKRQVSLIQKKVQTVASSSMLKWRPTIFLVGILISLGFVFTAFNLTQYEDRNRSHVIVWEEDLAPSLSIESHRIIRIEEKKKKVRAKEKPKTYIIEKVKEIIEEVKLIETDIKANDQVIDDITYSPDTISNSVDLLVKMDLPKDVVPDIVHMRVDVMPRFPGCGEISDRAKQKICADSKLLGYIQSQVVYPEIARANGIEGIVHVQFVVEKDGTISNIIVLRDIGGGCGKEAIRAVKTMNALKEKWSPGIQQGRIVKVRFTLPIHFTLRG